MNRDISLDRLPPQDIEAEESILSAILIDNDALIDVVDILSGGDFYKTAHQKIYAAITDLFSRNEPADLVTVATRLKEKGELEGIGGASYLALIADSAPIAMNAAHYAKIVKDKAILRNIIHSASNIIDECLKGRQKAEDIIDYSERSIMKAAEHRPSDNGAFIGHTIAESIDELTDLSKRNKGGLMGLSTGYPSIDVLTLGMQDSDLILLAGRPSMGKTALALNIARNVAIDSGKTVALFSLEMSIKQLAIRLLTAEAKIDSHNLRRGSLTQEMWNRIGKTGSLLTNVQIYVVDTAMVSTTDIMAQARRIKMDNDLGLVMVDYLQMMKPPPDMGRRDLEISEISRGLKSLARELDVPVLALSQLNRMVEQRLDKRPILADLRDSGALEQDADVVAFIYRDEVYNKENADNKGDAEIIIAKNRNGPTGTAMLKFTAEYTRFDEIDKETVY